jgi:hypothetical protein
MGIQLIKPLLDAVDKLINEHASAAVMKDHLGLLRDRLANVEIQIGELNAAHEKEIRDLKADHAKAIQELKSSYERQKLGTEQYIEHRGALFKRKGDGNFHEAVYCPRCRIATSPFPPFGRSPYTCNCGWIATFTPYDLKQVMSELN